MADIVDVAIIGGGPAGLAAAGTLARQAHTVVLFDSGKYRNAGARFMHNVTGWDHHDPMEFRAKARQDLGRYADVRLVDAEIQSAAKRPEGEEGAFELTDTQGKTWLARKVVLATGIEDVFLDVEGYAELWGTGVFHCLFCYGYEQRGGASAGVLCIDSDAASGAPLAPVSMARAPFALHSARQAAPLARAVTLYTHGNDALADDLTAAAPGPPFVVERRRIARMVGVPAAGDGAAAGADGQAAQGVAGVRVEFADGSAPREERFLTHHPKARLRAGALLEQLGVEVLPNGTVKTEGPFPKTNVPGVFVAGDCAGPFKAVPQALWTGYGAGVAASCQVGAERVGQKSLF